MPAEKSAATARPAPTQTPKTAGEIFARAKQLTDLEAAGVPFHLKATFVATGDAEYTGDGTYEIWWKSKKLWRVDATLQDFRLVSIQQGKNFRSYTSSSYVPLRLRQVLDGVLLYPAAHNAGSTCPRSCGTEWKQGHQQINGLDFTRLTSEYTCVSGKSKPTLCTLQYYFTPDGIPRIFANGSIDILYNDFQPFQKVEVPRSITLASGGKTWLEISIRSVEALRPSQKLLPEDATVKELQRHCALDLCGDDIKKAKIVEPKLIESTPAHYPARAKASRIQGSVVIRVTIDAHGKVREPYVLVSASSLLNEAALDSVRTYKFRPARTNGHPVSVGITIIVNFYLKH